MSLAPERSEQPERSDPSEQPGRPEQPGPPAEPVRPVGHGWITLYVLGNVGLFIPMLVPTTLLLPAQIAEIDPTGKVGSYAWVSVMGAISGIVLAPLAGALSDRTTSRFGRRRPWMAVGALIYMAVLVFLGLQTTVGGVAVGSFALSAACMIIGAGLSPVVPDQVPAGQRGIVLGWATAPQAGGLIAGGLLIGLVTGFSAQYLLLAAFPLLILLFATTLKDPPLPVRQREPFSLRTFLDGYRISPREHPDFIWAMSSRFAMGLGYGLGTLYLPYFLDDVLHYEELFPGRSTDDGLLIVIGVNSVATVSTVVFGGWLSDRLGRRRMPVFLGGLTMAVAAIPLALSPTWTMTLVAAVVLGLGYGVYLSVDTALITEVLPASADRSKDMALANLMTSLPYVLVPPIASVVLSGPGGYRSLFLCSAALSAVGAALVWKVRGVR
ncbi:MFS transporter [Streptomyces californicus]|uniref:MFS transporter n=1 Tax=Streptomyces californicus TaxID=67351 RepID=UPI00296F35E8|nr:MFS transporter [Streptomyces californicus]MDW4898384.1 MFS transporter [Streptomyces californicus]